ncbi:phage tail protein [Escherichia fergusonii]|uniref:phage tail protein n=1 Tax=Escherichia fergusonii TaxID=564 RepID=UPI0024335340|nr:phage tail protein [Escherichia fergusonii]WGA68577.1 phage tail protein [Escherichia fergusonii]
MGRFDEWFAEDANRADKESNHDSTQRETPASVETNAAGKAECGNIAETAFSFLEEQASSSDAGDVDIPDRAGGCTQNADAPDVAPLPSSLANREQSTQLKTRYNGHKAFNDQIRSDWMLIIESSPDAFQALLYRPDVGTYGVVNDETGEESFTELDNNQRELTYQEPEIVYVLDNPDGRDSFHALDADGEQDGLTDDVLILRIAANNVPVGSILEWNEEMANGVARRWWYVHRIFSYGTQHVGSLYYCIPARNFDTTQNGVIE